jgi:ACS family D-galactonate transporter-like MFS transporter
MSKPQPQKGAWAIVALLFLFMVINFADKAVIGLAAVPIMQELKLTPKEFGLVGSGFYLLFAVSAVLTGFVVNRVQTRWVLLALGLIWALTQFPILGPVGFATILACRVALGAGEGPAYPVALHATYKCFPNELRTLPTAVIAQGGGVGVLVSLPLLNLVIVHWGWHWAFGVLGFAGLAWVAVWLAVGREGAIADTETPGAGPAAGLRIPYSRLLVNPTIVASWCANFGAYWGLSLALTWQGAFMIKGLGFTQGGIGLLSALPPAISVIVLLAGGWLSQRLSAGGIGSRWARGVFGGAGVMLGGIALLVLPYMPNAGLQIAMTIIGTALPTVIYIIGPSIVGEITPVAQRGALLAIGTAIGTSAGLLAPYVTGSVVENAATPLAGFHFGYSICGAIMLLGGIIGASLMNPERELERLGGVAPTMQYRRA